MCKKLKLTLLLLCLPLHPVELVAGEEMVIHQEPAVALDNKLTASGLILSGSLHERKDNNEVVLLNNPQSSKQFTPQSLDQGDKNYRAQSKGGLAIPNALEWRTLNQRWNALSTQEKRRMGKLKYASRILLAQLAISSHDGTGIIKQNLLKLRADLPHERKKYYRNIQWLRDNNSLEFNHIKPFKNILDFMNSVRKFAKYTGVELFLDQPLLETSKMGLHIHVSRIDKKKFDRNVIRALNNLILLQLINEGWGSEAIKPSGEVRYRKNIESKGLLRLVNPGRLELRVFLQSPEKTLVRVFYLLNLPPKAALKEISEDILHELQKSSFKWLLDRDLKSPLDNIYTSLVQGIDPSKSFSLAVQLDIHDSYQKNQLKIYKWQYFSALFLELLESSQFTKIWSLLEKVKEKKISRKEESLLSISALLHLQVKDQFFRDYLLNLNRLKAGFTWKYLRHALRKEDDHKLIHKILFAMIILTKKHPELRKSFANIFNQSNNYTLAIISDIFLENPALFSKILNSKNLVLNDKLLDFLSQLSKQSDLFNSGIVKYFQHLSQNAANQSVIEKYLQEKANNNSTRVLQSLFDNRHKGFKNGCLYYIRRFFSH